MISNPHIINQLASQHIADLRLEAERERIRRGQRRRLRREAARWTTLNNVTSEGDSGPQDGVLRNSPRPPLPRIRRGRVHLRIRRN